MTRALVLVGDGVDDTHLAYAYHRLREDAVLVDVASPAGGAVRTARGASWATSALADLPPSRRYDLVVVPGGEATDALSDDRGVLDRLRTQHEAGDVVCAIGRGVELLAAIDALADRLVAGPSSLEAAGARPTGEAVTVDGHLVTVRDTEALPFGIAAALGNVVIPQGPAATASERPHWEA